MEDPKELEQTEPVPTPVEEQPPTEPDIDIEKTIQSERSKAKNEILKSLGIETVDDGKAKIARVSELEKALTEKEAAVAETAKSLNETKQAFEEFKKTTLYKELGIPEDKRADFDILVKAKVSDEHSFEEVAQSVASTYFPPAPIVTAVPAPPTAPPATVKTFGW